MTRNSKIVQVKQLAAKQEDGIKLNRKDRRAIKALNRQLGTALVESLSKSGFVTKSH